MIAVSMKSGLEGRNNCPAVCQRCCEGKGLNEVRPGRPEQLRREDGEIFIVKLVSMKSGLEGRNNCG